MNPMQRAIGEALKGINRGEGGPFGACIVDSDGNIIACAHNTVWKSMTPTAHAEINAINKAAKKLGRIDLSDCSIYTTTEPCPMCFSAIHWAKIKKIIFSTTISDAKKAGFNEINLTNKQFIEAAKMHNIKLIKDKKHLNDAKLLFKRWEELDGRKY